MGAWRVLSLSLAPLAVPGAVAACEDPAATLTAFCVSMWLLALAAAAVRQFGRPSRPALPPARLTRTR